MVLRSAGVMVNACVTSPAMTSVSPAAGGGAWPRTIAVLPALTLTQRATAAA